MLAVDIDLFSNTGLFNIRTVNLRVVLRTVNSHVIDTPFLIFFGQRLRTKDSIFQDFLLVFAELRLVAVRYRYYDNF